MPMKDLDINQVPASSEITQEEESTEDEDVEESPRKKLRLTKEQSRLLEECFTQNHTPSPKEKKSLAEHLDLKTRQVDVWFQNRRARSKMKQAEIECRYLKRWLGSLTQQNTRLQHEVDKLRATSAQAPSKCALIASLLPPLPPPLLNFRFCSRTFPTISLES